MERAIALSLQAEEVRVRKMGDLTTNKLISAEKMEDLGGNNMETCWFTMDTRQNGD